MIKFFDTNDSKNVITKFRRQIDALDPIEDFEKRRVRVIQIVVSSMEDDPGLWDELCQINISKKGVNFIRMIHVNEKNITYDMLDTMCSIFFQFLLEYYLSTNKEMPVDLEDARCFVFENISSFHFHAKRDINYAIHNLPIIILKNIINSDVIGNIKNLNNVVAKAEKLKKDWDTDLTKREKRVNKLEDALLKYENAFNFVGLYQGFDDLSKEKQKERDGILIWLILLSVVTFVPIIVQMIFIYNHVAKITLVGSGQAVLTFFTLSTFATFSIVAIAIYYFRVLLFNYKSVKSQLLQIDLRKTLCRFIQSYATYSSKIKKQDPKSLEKFESIIFSGIATDERNQPSPFYVGEQIEKLIEKFTKQ